MVESKKKSTQHPGTQWKLPSLSDLNKMDMWSTFATSLGFSIRRVLGGFMYEYDDGGKVFVSTDELEHE